MFSSKWPDLISRKLNSVKSAGGYLTMNLAVALLIAFIPTLSDALNIPISGGGSVGPNGASGGVSVGGLTSSFGTGGAAGGTGGIGDALCTVVGWFKYGSVGSAVASLAVIFLGIGAFFGKTNWGMAITLTAGIFAIFGADEIVGAITGGYGQECSAGY